MRIAVAWALLVTSVHDSKLRTPPGNRLIRSSSLSLHSAQATALRFQTGTIPRRVRVDSALVREFRAVAGKSEQDLFSGKGEGVAGVNRRHTPA